MSRLQRSGEGQRAGNVQAHTVRVWRWDLSQAARLPMPLTTAPPGGLESGGPARSPGSLCRSEAGPLGGAQGLTECLLTGLPPRERDRGKLPAAPGPHPDPAWGRLPPGGPGEAPSTPHSARLPACLPRGALAPGNLVPSCSGNRTSPTLTASGSGRPPCWGCHPPTKLSGAAVTSLSDLVDHGGPLF